MVLECWLNEYFKTTGIEIVNTFSTFENTYIYRDTEIGDIADSNQYLYRDGEALLSDQVYLFNQSEVNTDFDFVVNVPAALINGGVTIQSIKSVVNKYKYMGVTFEVVII